MWPNGLNIYFEISFNFKNKYMDKCPLVVLDQNARNATKKCKLIPIKIRLRPPVA
jgi:hypothetical protein